MEWTARLGAGDFGLGAGHRRIAISLLAGTLCWQVTNKPRTPWRRMLPSAGLASVVGRFPDTIGKDVDRVSSLQHHAPAKPGLRAGGADWVSRNAPAAAS
jgi:hypothetical protein